MFESLNDFYISAMQEVITKGSTTGNTIELIGHTQTLTNATSSKLEGEVQDKRNINYYFADSYAQSVVRGDAYYSKIDHLSDRAKTYVNPKLPDGLPPSFSLAYGSRLKSQEKALVRELNSGVNSRRAYATVWSPEDYLLIHGNNQFEGEFACTGSLHFFKRDLALHLHVHMRSSNAYRILPIDMFLFSSYLQYIGSQCQDINRLGNISVSFGSLHIFLDDLEKAKDILSI
jgi:thymidylate synthase